MSTERQSRDEAYTLTSFYGGDKRGRCLQVTGAMDGLVQLTYTQAGSLIMDLQDFRDGALKEEDI